MPKKRILYLILGLLMIVTGSILFALAVSGAFDPAETELDAEYYCEGTCEGDFTELGKDEYEDLIKKKKSFVIFVDQNGCDGADRLRKFSNDYFPESGVKVYRMMFEDLKETTLHEKVKYYPSIVVIRKGNVRAFLRADSDEDAGAFNQYGSFIDWVNQHISLNSLKKS
ncbi:hypothetical protein IJI89_02310 [Candidatus Saccharibacteria bacterium]|nr:hypothetical protein [Candidatus Saccharibacteria bacterium]